ncbi:MarR family transcriptional regulator [Pelobium sp.]|nr:MarR family transcriptional regulator [Pelobium sp.]MDA9555222.1 MarR family transcriptional regulator [Pelobium sp.]
MQKYEEPLVHQLIQITKKYLSAFGDIVQDIPLERYHYTLLLIDEHQETLTQKALAELLQVDKSFLVNMIDYLAENGFVYRETNSDDRRQQVIKLTAKAKTYIPEISACIKNLNQSALENIPKEHIQIFLNTITTIQNNLKTISSHEIVLDYKKMK